MTEPFDPGIDNAFVWNGVLDASLLIPDVVRAGHRFADAAMAGDWSTVLTLLDGPGQAVDINWWRPGGTAWFTVLHQAAWHGAPTEVAAELIRRGAVRSLTESRGRTAYDVAIQQNVKAKRGIHVQQLALLELRERFLMPPPSPLATREIGALDGYLADVINGRIGVLFDGRDPRRVLRYPPVAILHEVPDQRLWFPVPGMYGGFHITLRQDYLDVKSWCRISGGSGQAHVITRAGAILVDEGFV